MLLDIFPEYIKRNRIKLEKNGIKGIDITNYFFTDIINHADKKKKVNHCITINDKSLVIDLLCCIEYCVFK